MQFIKFRSLTNAYNQKFINYCEEAGVRDWVVTEKIHGANMGLYCDGTKVRPASRNNLVGTDFFNCGATVARYTEAVWKVFKHIEEIVEGDVSYIIVYGEYFGGLFQGVPHVDQAKKVQKGIEYTPDNDFMAFNCLVVDGDNNESWISTVELKAYADAENTNLRVVPILSYGSLTECLGFPNDNESVVPAIYGLTPQGTNVSEGVVITPRNGEEYLYGELFLGIKNKNEKWSEKGSAPRVPQKLPEELKEELEALGRYATENRFNNVMSKEGEIDPKQFGRYLGLFLKDIYDEYLAEGGLLPEEQKDRKVLQKELTKICRPFIVQAINGG